MSTGNQNLDLLVKLLSLTTSNNDGEALSAMRMANRQLEKFKLTWPEFVKARITVAADPFAIPVPRPAQHEAPRTAAPPPVTPSMHRAYTSAPTPPPPPRPAAPPPAPPPPSEYTYAAGTKPNKFATLCCSCSRKLAPGDGLLWRIHNQKQRWDTRCGPNFGCQATGRKPQRKIDAQTIDDILNGA